jgi:hypothetical protein
MKTTSGMMLVATVVGLGWLGVAVGQNDGVVINPDAPVQNPDGPAPMPPDAGVNDPGVVPGFPGMAQDNEAPRRAAREFAPWIEALIQEKVNVATRLFPLRRSAKDTVEAAATLRIFRKFPKLDGHELALIGGRGLGGQTGVLLFTITSESGPVAFKIYHYRFGNTRSVSKLEITDDWSEIEKMYTTVDPLPAPVLVPL